MDFSEQQKMNNPVILIVFLIGVLVAMTGVSVALYQSYKSGESIYTLIWAPVFIMAIETVAYYFIFQTLLETRVSAEGFSFKYFPYVRKFKTVPFNEISSWRIKSIRNIFEHRLGYRKSVFSRKTEFAMGSKELLELKLSNGKLFVFSTDNSYSLTTALKKYIAEKEIR